MNRSQRRRNAQTAMPGKGQVFDVSTMTTETLALSALAMVNQIRRLEQNVITIEQELQRRNAPKKTAPQEPNVTP